MSKRSKLIVSIFHMEFNFFKKRIVCLKNNFKKEQRVALIIKKSMILIVFFVWYIVWYMTKNYVHSVNVVEESECLQAVAVCWYFWLTVAAFKS